MFTFDVKTEARTDDPVVLVQDYHFALLPRMIKQRRPDARVAVAEASQLLEAATEGRYDRVVVVVAPEEERVRRWTGKGGDPDVSYTARLLADRGDLEGSSTLTYLIASKADIREELDRRD